MADKTYIGIASLTLVKRTSGSTEYVYAGGPVPGDADPETLARLLDEGFIAESDGDVSGSQIDVPGQTLAETRPARTRRSAKDKAADAAAAKAAADAEAKEKADAEAKAAAEAAAAAGTGTNPPAS